ncbi:SpoIIE family protein phosphatase [Streptomyces sp.]|uniref:SpoIIE family protein phosphatase n=2 Tax=Streptomyces sp. TaxID=1931 RepID=UPI002811F2E8|nr:SpoIIE family protein phosphatase [Streptomyces sp.]
MGAPDGEAARPAPGTAADGARTDVFEDGRMDAVLADVMRDTGASIGLLYLLVPQERSLRLALISGVSPEIAAPWVRVPADAPVPVADAVRDRRFVWLGSRQEIAHRYPRVGIVLPYEFMLAAAPVAEGGTGPVHGGIVLLWPVWHPPRLDDRERAMLDECCRRAARLLAPVAGQPPPSLPAEPRAVYAARPSETDPALGAAAVEFAERLPVGCCALDLDGRVTFLNSAGARLVNAGAAFLLGRRPWEVLLWLDDPAFEDSYREAVITRRPTSVTVVRRPSTRLRFDLHPDATGVSVHITEVAGPPLGGPYATPGADEPATGPPHEETPGAAVSPGAAAAAVAGAATAAGAAGAAGGGADALPEPVTEPVGAGAVYRLMHLAASLAQAAGVHEVVELVADQIVPAFGPRGLVMMSADQGRLRIVGHRGYRQDFVERFDNTPLTADVADAQVLTTGVPLFFTDVDDLLRTHPHAPRYEGRNAWAFLPLIASGRPVGSLILSYEQPRPFPPAERALLTSLAGLIAQAVARARLYDAKQSLAHSLQTGLLPHSLHPPPGVKVAARYLPAGHGMEVGGDFYDLVRATPTTAIAVIGDVQGHNTAAAALMGQVRTAVHAHATAGASPGDILARTNRLLTDLDTDRFTSCLIVELDLAHGRLRLATAGHPPPLLRGPDGGARVLDVEPGLVLGIAPDVTYRTTEVPWEPGSVLALYTDGLVEAPGTDLGAAMTDLADRLARSRFAGDPDRLADELIRHVEDATHRADDVALLLVHRAD